MNILSRVLRRWMEWIDPPTHSCSELTWEYFRVAIGFERKCTVCSKRQILQWYDKRLQFYSAKNVWEDQ